MSAVSLPSIARSNVIGEVRELYVEICARELAQLMKLMRGRFIKGAMVLVPIILALVVVGHFWISVMAVSFWFVAMLFICEPVLQSAKQISDRRKVLLQDLGTIRWMIDGGGVCSLECSASHPEAAVVDLRVEVVTPGSVIDGITIIGKRKSTSCQLSRPDAVAIVRKYASLSDPIAVDGCDRIPQRDP